MNLDVIITGCTGLATTIISSVVSWLLARKKYNTEVDSNEIENLKKSLEFYEDIVQDNNKKLQFYIDISETNRVEVYRLKGIVYRILNDSCLDTECTLRKFYTTEEIKDILGTLVPQKKERKNGSTIEKTV